MAYFVPGGFIHADDSRSHHEPPPLPYSSLRLMMVILTAADGHSSSDPEPRAGDWEGGGRMFGEGCAFRHFPEGAVSQLHKALTAHC